MKTGGIEIRPLEIDDLSEVFVLGGELFSGKNFRFSRVWSEKVLAEILANSLEMSFVALRKKILAGFLIGTTVEDGSDGMSAEIIWLGARGLEQSDTGHGLIEAFIAGCAERNIRNIRIEITADESDLIEMCRKSGFYQTGQISIMERTLT
jgi:hypothetical protein